MSRTDHRRTWRCAAGGSLLAVALLLAVGAYNAPASSDPCTQTLSNPGTSIGSSGRNVICGTNGDDRLEGRGGNDELRGFGGEDVLLGGTGEDELFGAGGEDSLSGEDGSDTLNGGSGGDDLNGGNAGDTLIGGSGMDSIGGRAGNDFINVRDGELDGWSCGDGTDTLQADLVDAFVDTVSFFVLVRGCEAYTVAAVDEGPTVSISSRSRRLSRAGRTRVRLSCPASLTQPSRCEGRLKLQLSSPRSLRRRAPRTRYSIGPGQSQNVSVRLSRRDRRTVNRRGRASGAATSVEEGEHGTKTTVETIKLRTRR